MKAFLPYIVSVIALACPLSAGVGIAKKSSTSSVRGKACPEFVLKPKAIQGETPSTKELIGHVSMFVFWEPTTSAGAMKDLQALYQEYRDDPEYGKDVKIFAICSTEIGAGRGPVGMGWLDGQIRGILRDNGWTMPVSRDFPVFASSGRCQTMAKFHIDGKCETPMAVVVDRAGVVVAHEPRINSTLVTTFENEVKGLDTILVPRTRKLAKELEPASKFIDEGRYLEALEFAEKVLHENKLTPDEERAILLLDIDEKEAADEQGFNDPLLAKKIRVSKDGHYVATLIKASLKRITAFKKHDFEYNPPRVLGLVKRSATSFSGIEGAEELSKRTKAWGESGKVEQFQEWQQSLSKVRKEMKEAKDSMTDELKQAFLNRLTTLSKEAKESCLAHEIEEQMASLISE